MTTMPATVSNDAMLPILDDRFRTIVRAFTVWAQGAFANMPVGQYRWRGNRDETEIIIQGTEAIDLDQTNRRPRITVSHSGGRYAGTSVGQISQYPLGPVHNTIITDLVPTSVVISVVAPTAAEASSIGYILFMLFPVFRLQLQLLGRLHQLGNNIAVSDPRPANGPQQGASGQYWKEVTLAVPAVFQVYLDVSDDTVHSYIRSVEMSMQTILGNTGST